MQYNTVSRFRLEHRLASLPFMFVYLYFAHVFLLQRKRQVIFFSST